MEEIFFSFTFGGETLSLAAALATMKKLQEKPVIETLRIQGEKILIGLKDLIEKYQCDQFLSVSGHPAWSFFLIQDTPFYSMWEIKTLFMQEMLERGILAFGTHNMSFSHNDADIAKLLSVYDEVLPIMKDAVENKKMNKYLRCKPLEPLFKVR